MSQRRDKSRNNGKPQNKPTGKPLPRKPRRPRRPETDRGLAPDADLRQLATEYLNRQRKLWPELVKANLLPEPTTDVVDLMVEDFKRRHRTGEVDLRQLDVWVQLGLTLADEYLRYSCHNSKPTSISDQNNANLDKAASERRFIPWQYVFADYSVSGLIASRVGYCAFKRNLETVHAKAGYRIDTTYIFDFSRASRDELEWWDLAHLVKSLNGRLIGASDGFDLSSEMAEAMVSLYGLLSKLFIKNLRRNVGRGMRSAAARGTCLGKPPFGFTRCAVLDDHGREIRNSDGTFLTEICIDPETEPYLKEIIDLFLVKKWSAFKIAQEFNLRRIDDWDRWTATGIRMILRNSAMIGRFVWNRYRTEYDYKKEKNVRKLNPRKEWIVTYARDKAVVSVETYFAILRRFIKTRRGKRRDRVNRNENYPRMLFDFACRDCQKDLSRNRGKSRPVLCCKNGQARAAGCTLHTNKSVRILEKAMLKFLLEQVLTDDRVRQLVADGNKYLAQQAAKAPVDVAPLKREIRRLEAETDRLITTVRGTKNERVRQRYHRQIEDLQEQIDAREANIQELLPIKAEEYPRLDEETLLAYLADTREVLNQDVAVASAALRPLVGRITVYQDNSVPAKRGAVWKAVFSPNLPKYLEEITADKNSPITATLEYLSSRIWTSLEMVEISIDFVPRYEEVAEQVLEMHNRNVSGAVIEQTLGICSQQRQAALRFAQTGKRPAKKPSKPKKACERNPVNAGKGRTNWCKDRAEEVARLRDAEGLSFAEISRRLGKHANLIYKAYDFAHPEIVADAVEHGHAIRRDLQKARLRPHEKARLDGLLLAGTRTGVVAKLIGCSLQSVIRRKARLAKHDVAAYGRMVNESLANDREFLGLLAEASESQAALNQPGLRSRRLSPDQVASAEKSIIVGDPVKVTAQLVGCSTKTIVEMRKRMRTDRAA